MMTPNDDATTTRYVDADVLVGPCCDISDPQIEDLGSKD